MRTDFILRCQQLTSQTTTEIMHNEQLADHHLQKYAMPGHGPGQHACGGGAKPWPNGAGAEANEPVPMQGWESECRRWF